MTSIEDGAAPRRLATSTAQKFGHLNARVWPWLVTGTLALAVVLRLTGLKILAIPLCVLFVAAAFGQLVLERRHNRHLCEACIIALPLDPGARAERIRRRLRFVHWTIERPWASGIVMIVMLGSAGGMDLGGDPRGLTLLAVMSPLLVLLAVLLWYIFAVEAHRKLQPWCPYCQRKGGGGGLHMPSPGPVDSTSRRR